MKKDLVNLDVSTIQGKEYLTDIINFWLHDFLLVVAQNDLDNDDIYNVAVHLVKFKQRIRKNKKVVELTSTFQLAIFLNVVDTFIECAISHQTGQVNDKYIHNLDEIKSILELGSYLLHLDNKYVSSYPLSKKETIFYESVVKVIRTIEDTKKDLFDSRCHGNIAVHFN